jgi:hypothetical protein
VPRKASKETGQAKQLTLNRNPLDSLFGIKWIWIQRLQVEWQSPTFLSNVPLWRFLMYCN